MPTIFIDDKPFDVGMGKNLLHVSLSLGFDVPYFCWHESLGAIGACRQCAVVQFKDAEDKNGRIVMSCMTEALDGARFSIDHINAKNFRKNVIEWMMTNHPHDCPVCDEGGECHLQDMTIMTGHNYRRYRFKKRTFKNQNLGPFVYHEMNRCITCYRCVRFYKDYAHGTDLGAFRSSNQVYFGRANDGILESEFSGNLIEVCPTGVFTDKVFRTRYVRKWDLQSSPAICQLCSLGCNIFPQERGNILRRVTNRYHPKINGYFLCDKGRFGHDFVNNEQRIKWNSQKGIKLSKEEAKEKFKSLLKKANKIVGIGSPKASLEDNFSLKKLVGADNFYAGVNIKEWEMTTLVRDILQNGTNEIASLKDIEESDLILVIQEDILKNAPRLYLSTLQSLYTAMKEKGKQLGIPYWHDSALRNLSPLEKAPIWQIMSHNTKLDDKVMVSLKQSLEETSVFIENLILDLNEESSKSELAKKLLSSKRPVIIGGVSCKNEKIIKATANLVSLLRMRAIDCKIHFVLPSANSMGLSLLKAKNINELNNNFDLAIVIKSDYDFEALFFQGEKFICIDFLENPIQNKAELILACTSFLEETGTFVNNEGRAQRSYAVMPKSQDIEEVFRLCLSSDYDVDLITEKLILEDDTIFAELNRLPTKNYLIQDQKIPRQQPGFSGKTALNASINIHEQPPKKDFDSPLKFSMEGIRKDVPANLLTSLYKDLWNSNQSIVKFQKEPGGDYKEEGVEIFLIKPNKNLASKFLATKKNSNDYSEDNMGVSL